MFARIVACVDPSAAGRHAAEVGVEVAHRFNCGLTFLTVLPWKDHDQPDLERLVPMDAEGRSIHRIVEEIQTAAKEKGVKSVEIAYLRGNVAEALLENLTENPPDLVVVGTRGLSRGSRILLGSVSSRLVAEAPCPVLVVRQVRRRPRKPSAAHSSR